MIDRDDPPGFVMSPGGGRAACVLSQRSRWCERALLAYAFKGVDSEHRRHVKPLPFSQPSAMRAVFLFPPVWTAAAQAFPLRHV